MIKLIYIIVTLMLINTNAYHSLIAAADINNDYVIEIIESADIQEVEEEELAKETFAEYEEIDPQKPMIAITFDDGPSGKYTPVILDVLKENNIKATFFVLGSQVKKNEDVIVRMVKEGHELGNHSYNHKKLYLITDEELNHQITDTDDLIENITGERTTLLRPPYGYTNEKFNEKITKPIILWSVDTRDWESRNAEIVRDKILKEVKDGDIILMHDIHASTAEAVKEVIPELIERGYQLVTVSELYEYREATLLPGKVYRKLVNK